MTNTREQALYVGDVQSVKLWEAALRRAYEVRMMEPERVCGSYNINVEVLDI